MLPELIKTSWGRKYCRIGCKMWDRFNLQSIDDACGSGIGERWRVGWKGTSKQAGSGTSSAQPLASRPQTSGAHDLPFAHFAHLHISPTAHLQFTRNLGNHYCRRFHLLPHFKHCTYFSQNNLHGNPCVKSLTCKLSIWTLNSLSDRCNQRHLVCHLHRMFQFEHLAY